MNADDWKSSIMSRVSTIACHLLNSQVNTLISTIYLGRLAWVAKTAVLKNGKIVQNYAQAYAHMLISSKTSKQKLKPKLNLKNNMFNLAFEANILGSPISTIFAF